MYKIPIYGIFETGDGTYAGSSTSTGASFPSSFAADGPGSLTVRGRIIDKDDGYTDYTTTFTINNVPPTAVSVSGPADALVGQVVNFALTATDVPADQAAGFTYIIDWGDGSLLETINPVSGTGKAIVGHAYAAANNYSIEVTATDKDSGISGTPGSTSIQIDAVDASNLEDLLDMTPFVELTPTDDAALQSLVTAINGLSAPISTTAITIILDDEPYSGVTLGPPDNIILNLAGNDTRDVDGTQISSTTGSAVTVTSGEVFLQGNRMATSANAPAVLVTGGHLTLDQVEVEETDGFINVAVKVTDGGGANLGFDVLMKIHGVGAFVDTYARSALVPHPEGIDAELTPNTYQWADGIVDDTINAVSLSSTSLTSSMNPSDEDESVVFTATVDVKAIEHGLATGTVSFYDGETLLGEGIVNYVGGQFVAGFTTDALPVGDHVITAVYNGDTAYVASLAELAHKVVIVTTPTADVGGPYFGPVNADIQFDGSGSSDPNGDELTYNWDFGDNSSGTGVTPTHSYSVAGTYDVCLTVSDGEFTSEKSCTVVTVNLYTVFLPLVTR